MIKVSSLFLIIVLFVQCKSSSVSNTGVPLFNIEVVDAYIQKEVPGVAGVPSKVYVNLEVKHSENVTIQSITIQDQKIDLKGKVFFRGFFSEGTFNTQKNMDQKGVIEYSLEGKLRQLNVYEIIQKEPVYLP